MKTTTTIKTENEFIEMFIWLLQRIEEVKRLNLKSQKYLGQNYLNALLDVKKMCLMKNPLLSSIYKKEKARIEKQQQQEKEMEELKTCQRKELSEILNPK